MRGKGRALGCALHLLQALIDIRRELAHVWYVLWLFLAGDGEANLEDVILVGQGYK